MTTALWIAQAVTIGIGYLTTASTPDAAASILEMVESIVNQHDKLLSELSEPSAIKIKQIIDTRNGQLHALINTHIEQLNRLDATDLAALALAAEHLRDHRLAIRFARMAVELNQECENAYRTLIRSHLNLNEPTEAIDILEQAEGALSRSCNITALRYLIFRRLIANRDTVCAQSQIQAYFEWQRERLEYDPIRACEGIGGKLDEYISIHRQNEANILLKERLNSIHRSLQIAEDRLSVDATSENKTQAQSQIKTLLERVGELAAQ